MKDNVKRLMTVGLLAAAAMASFPQMARADWDDRWEHHRCHGWSNHPWYPGGGAWYQNHYGYGAQPRWNNWGGYNSYNYGYGAPYGGYGGYNGYGYGSGLGGLLSSGIGSMIMSHYGHW